MIDRKIVLDKMIVMKNCTPLAVSFLLLLGACVCCGAAARQRSDQGGVAHVGAEPGRREARERLVEEITVAWEKGSGRGQPFRLVVLDCDERGRAYKSELRQLFPDGTKHLPEPLVSRAVYTTRRGGGGVCSISASGRAAASGSRCFACPTAKTTERRAESKLRLGGMTGKPPLDKRRRQTRNQHSF